MTRECSPLPQSCYISPGEQKMDVKKNKNSMYIKIKKNKQSCCRLPDAKKKKEVKNKMDVKN